MSPTTPPLNPSQAVERIREIIVGRHLERLEQRVARLEATSTPVPAAVVAPQNVLLEDRILAGEARVEALKENLRRQLDATRQQSELHFSQQREETQRLAAQIQQVAATKASQSQPPVVQQLEQKIGSWLASWQNSFHQQLNDRDQRLAGELRKEVAMLWENTESQITRIQSRAVDRDSIEERFNRIALAARALAECASPSAVPPGATPPLMLAVMTPLPSPSPGLPARSGMPRISTPLPWSPFQGPARPFPALASLPAWPGPPTTGSQAFPSNWPAPIADLPAPAAAEAPAPFVPVPPPAPDKPVEPPAPDFTDEDLREAFGPIVEQAVRSAVYAKENGIDTYLEPMLRATIRRALAEYAPASRPFRAAGAYDRLMWHVQALFTSRTYEDIVFEKTHRFQVEEVFLLEADSLALVSFASCDPARHSSAKRVAPTVHRLALALRDESGKIHESFELPEQRNAITCAGGLVHLVAVVRGRPSELILADLEFALRRIEDRFREQFQKKGTPLLFTLQPYLEDCLLIQAPASAA